MSYTAWRAIGSVLLISLSMAAAGLSAQEHQHPPGQPTTDTGPVPLYDNLGTLHKTITTRSEEAQQYFDQGLRLTYAFNHDEAIKSFKQGLKHDSTCAMCYWGIAYALGPNINAPMDTSAVRPAYDAVQNALKYIRDVSGLERGMIEALTKRYSPDPAASRPALDSAWANAIGLVAYAYPKDDDAAVLHAEALMDLRPWDYWTNGGRPKARSTLDQLRVLQKVVKRNPNHPGACHYYIHAIEASSDAYKALPCAQRLGSLMPGAGHLVHMPTHIYIKLGQWDLAAEHNAHALRADEEFISERHPTGAYPMGYYPHNFHVMWYSLNMLGRSAEAIKTARSIGEKVPVEVVRQVAPLEGYTPALLYTLVRFARWDDVLKQPAPPADLRYATGAWFYARSLAFTATGQPGPAAVARDSLLAIARAMPADRSIGINRAKPVLELAANHLAGEMAAKQGDINEAVKRLRAAAAQEDELQYEEPPAWYMPIRQRLGAVLLAAGRAKDAEKAFREDLAQRPENGWSLHGLARSLTAQGRVREAKKVEDRFRKAWGSADVQPDRLTSAASTETDDSTLQHVECRRAAPGQKPGATGCTILGARRVGKLPDKPLFWSLVAFPTRAEAEAAAGPTGVVAEAEGRQWVFSIGPDDGGPQRGERVAFVGPLEIPLLDSYMIEVALAVLPPGSKSRVHTHSGPEAWYLLKGEQCLETPSGAHRTGSGQGIAQAGYTPMQLVATGKVVRRALVVVVHDATTGWGAPSEWKPKGLCS